MENKNSIKPKSKLKRNHFTKKRRPYKNYSLAEWEWPEIINDALILKESENNFIEIIAKKYGIVYDTLKTKFSLYLKYGSSIFIDARGKSNKTFTDQEELIMAEDIKKNFIDKNVPFDNTDLKIMALQIWKKNYLGNDTEFPLEDFNCVDLNDFEFHASDGWCTAFKNRHRISSVTPTKKKNCQ